MGLIIRSSAIHATGYYTPWRSAKARSLPEYTGSRLTRAEADLVCKNSPITYLFGLDDGSVVIDGHCMAMFVYHSCNANCETIEEDGRVWSRGADRGLIKKWARFRALSITGTEGTG